jgi:ABC-type Zn2+ transport system substrate-binding protein/surface adhesin
VTNSLARRLAIGTCLAALLLPAACSRHEVELKPVEIKPIHITIDINLKVDRALDDFFGDLDKAQADPSVIKP